MKPRSRCNLALNEVAQVWIMQTWMASRIFFSPAVKRWARKSGPMASVSNRNARFSAGVEGSNDSSLFGPSEAAAAGHVAAKPTTPARTANVRLPRLPRLRAVRFNWLGLLMPIRSSGSTVDIRVPQKCCETMYLNVVSQPSIGHSERQLHNGFGVFPIVQPSVRRPTREHVFDIGPGLRKRN